EINGHKPDERDERTGRPRLVGGFSELKDDGTTACGCWVYSGVFPEPDRNRANERRLTDNPLQPEWGFAWPHNRRIMYNRASADLQGRPWSERKKWVWWDPARRQWVGYDVPDFTPTKPPDAPADPNGTGLDAHSGTDPFIMKADGKGWLFAPSGYVDGPLPTHYEAAESPVQNPLYRQQLNPVLKYWQRDDNPLAALGDTRFPYVITTYRLTETYLSGAMNRWVPWLAQLQPESFIEISPELASERGIKNLDMVRIATPRAEIRARALVTGRVLPLTIAGRRVHQVGMPWPWGYMGIVTGDVTNDLTSLVADPNVTIHEGKAFMCNLEKA
ncbi:MAG TPA: molybdopterin dinucleotide binding domain-containing protein, partial [Chloroflexota bacterium]|nr:molybdopterin dinucleotide binding domain-containing protein [Chloroflexota bacterium]